jgi:hypothetical protein
LRNVQKLFDSVDLGTRLLQAEIRTHLGNCPHAAGMMET